MRPFLPDTRHLPVLLAAALLSLVVLRCAAEHKAPQTGGAVAPPVATEKTTAPPAAPPATATAGAAAEPPKPAAPVAPPPGSEPGPVTVTWLGTAGLYVTDGRTAFLIDPFVSRYGIARVLSGLALEPKLTLIDDWIKRLGVPRGTPVLVTHSHYDHALDAPYFAQALGGKLYGSGSTVYVGIGAGLKPDAMHQVAAGETLTLGDFRIRFMASCHGPQFAGLELWTGTIDEPLEQPANARSYKVGDHFSLAIEHPRATFYHQSSACLLPGMYDGVHADTIFLGISARSDTMALVTPALLGTGARRIVPIHWDDFFEPLSDGPSPVTGVDLPEFRETVRVERPDVELKELGFGEALAL